MSLDRDKGDKSRSQGGAKPPLNKPALGSSGGGGMVRKAALPPSPNAAPASAVESPAEDDSSSGDSAGPPARVTRPPAKKFGKQSVGDVAGDPQEELERIAEALQLNPQDEDLHMRRYEIARRHSERGDLLQTLEDAAALCPAKPFFAIKLAALHEEDERFDRALGLRRQVAQTTPDDPDAWKRLAQTALKARDLAAAEEAYDKLLSLRKSDDNPLGGNFLEEVTGVGLPPQQRAQLQALGLRVLQKAIANRPDSVPLLEVSARLAVRAGDLQGAIQSYRGLLQLKPEHQSVRNWKTELLRTYVRAGMPEEWQQLSAELIDDYRRFLEKTPRDGRSWLLLGRQYVQAGHNEEAVHALRSAQACDSQDWQSIYELGKLLTKMGRQDEAVQFYEDLLDPFGNSGPERKSIRRALEKAQAELYFHLGRYQESLGIYSRDEEANTRYIAPIYEAVAEYEKAQELYLKTVKQTPVDADAYLRLSEYHVRRGQWAEAESTARKGLGCKNAHGDILEGLCLVLATALMKQKRVEDAIATMDHAVQSTPDSPSMLFRKVKLLYLCGRQQEGRTLAEQVADILRRQIACAPAASGLWSLLGDCRSLLGQHEEAGQAYAYALDYDKMDAAAWRGLGVLYERKQNLVEAINCYKNFVRLDPINLATHPIQEKIAALEAQLAPAS
ncbi:MAG: tetratricopeptide repeat protein [Candidatus Xenobia bacterium]